MKKINVIIRDKTTLVLQEDAQKGDIIDLSDLQKVDLAHIDKLIQSEKEQHYQKKIEEEFELKKELLQKDYEKTLLMETTSYKSQVKELEDKIESLENKSHLEKENEIIQLRSRWELEKKELAAQNQQTQTEKEKKFTKEKTELESSINQLKLELENVKKTQEMQIKNQTLKVQHEFEEKIRLLNQQNAELDTQLKLKDNEKTLAITESQLKIEKIKQELTSEKQIIQEELNKLTLTKSLLNSKMLGESLEKWCNEEYESYATTGFEYSTWEKDNTNVKDESDLKGTKADYIFKTHLDKEQTIELSSVCCEMKNEGIDSKTKKKNADHYDKLDKDRRKKNCEYALLISELEWDSNNDTPIKKVREYEKMYVVRPQYFITFLSLIASLATKYRDILTEKKQQELSFESSIKLQEDFDKLKNTYLEKPLETLEKKIQKILDSTEAITKANQCIQTTCGELIAKDINSMRDKIERFDIRKMVRELKSVNHEE